MWQLATPLFHHRSARRSLRAPHAFTPRRDPRVIDRPPSVASCLSLSGVSSLQRGSGGGFPPRARPPRRASSSKKTLRGSGADHLLNDRSVCSALFMNQCRPAVRSLLPGNPDELPLVNKESKYTRRLIADKFCWGVIPMFFNFILFYSIFFYS